MIVLDTDHASLLEWETSPQAQRLRERLDAVAALEQATTILTFEEQVRGWLARIHRARREEERVRFYRKLQRTIELFSQFQVLAYNEVAPQEYQRLRRMKISIGAIDLRIAAICLSLGATLLSRNLADFRRVPELTVEDWSV
ncbi:MAG: type II toxin-antitoxin system VapC family toxin [Gemmataceae bacterium]|nr:type II toxin-antitoxin system VapC family toxin [Gemmataceae bacterium]